MSGLRELLAVVLGLGLGIVLVVVPRIVLRLSVFLDLQRRRRGDYGTDAVIPDVWVWIARMVGVLCIAIAVLIAYRTYG